MDNRLATHQRRELGQQALYNAMSEAELTENVRDYARQGGWYRYHTLRPKGSPAGWPDEVLIRAGVMIVAELKRQREQPTLDQARVIELLRDVVDAVRRLALVTAAPAGTEDLPIQVYVWRPSDLPDIQRILLQPPSAKARPG